MVLSYHAPLVADCAVVACLECKDVHIGPFGIWAKKQTATRSDCKVLPTCNLI